MSGVGAAARRRGVLVCGDVWTDALLGGGEAHEEAMGFLQAARGCRLLVTAVDASRVFDAVLQGPGAGAAWEAALELWQDATVVAVGSAEYERALALGGGHGVTLAACLDAAAAESARAGLVVGGQPGPRGCAVTWARPSAAMETLAGR